MKAKNKYMNIQLDKENLRQVILDGPKQFELGMDLADNIEVEGDFESITISGMGGSALPGDLLKIFVDSLFDKKEKLFSVYSNRFYELPKEAYHKSLNIICSYSGNTEETISSFQEALDAQLPCIGISSGGKIEEMCKENKIPHVKLPEGIQPRMATGYFFSSYVKILSNLGLIPEQEFGRLRDKLKEEMRDAEKQGKELAEKLIGKTPIVYSTSKYGALAMIWKIKFNENSKVPSFWNVFPELNHNEMVGFTNPQADFFMIMLEDENDHLQNIKRFEIMSQIMKGKNIESKTISLKGETLDKIFLALLIGDWTSYYLALAYSQDPTPVEMVEEFKSLLK